MKNINERSTDELRADVYKLIDDMCGVANPSEIEEFEAALYKSIEDMANNKGPEEYRLTPTEIKVRDKVNAEIKRLGLDEEDEHDSRIIGNLFDKFIKEEGEK